MTSRNINRLQSIYNGLRLDTTSLSSIRTTKKNVHDTIHTSLTTSTDVTDIAYLNYKRQKDQLDQNQPITTPPQLLGAYYDLTTFTDPGDGFEYYPYVFGKTLRHNTTTGFVRKDDADSVMNVVKYNDLETIAGITYDTGSARSLEGIFVPNGKLQVGAQNFAVGLTNTPGDIDSKTQMFEMLEVYGKNIARDQPFHSSFWERSTTLTGNASGVSGASTLDGSGGIASTFQTDELEVGDAIEVNNEVYLVASIASETSLGISGHFRSTFNDQTVKNISRKVLTGSIDPTASTAVVGSGTAFTTEVAIGDRITVSGETRTVVSITDATNLTVDTAFSDNANDTSPLVLPLSGNIVADLNIYNEHSANPTITAPNTNGTITSKLLFRGNGEDEQYGPYISQLLLKPFRYGNLTVEQKFHPDNDPADGDKANKATDWLEQQRGIKVFNDSLTDTGTSKYVYSPRMLGSVVHNDPLFQCYYDAALILNQSGVGVTGLDSSYNTSTWIDGGPPSVLGSISEVAMRALRVAWYGKYGLTMKIRPEVMAQRITFASQAGNTAYLDGGANPVSKLSNIKTNAEFCPNLLTKVNDWNVAKGGDALSGKNYYLNSQYEEGSPTHPSLPAGHAVVAGACTTVLKAMVITRTAGTDAKILWIAGGRTAEQSDITGDNLISYAESDATSMTLIGELNKLASNIALGRDFAGVHYRTDGDGGMKMGEDYAITFLQDKIKEYGSYENGTFTHFDLTKFDGTRIKIYANRIENV